MEPKHLTLDQQIARIGALCMKLDPLGFERVERPSGGYHEVFHSPYCGDVDFSAVHSDSAVPYALRMIVERAREEGARTAQWKMREALGLPLPDVYK